MKFTYYVIIISIIELILGVILAVIFYKNIATMIVSILLGLAGLINLILGALAFAKR